MQNEKGYASLIMILVALLLGLLFFYYIWNGQWFVPRDGYGQPISGSDTGQNLNAQQQIDTVRQNMKNIQNQRDQDIYKAMGD